MGGVRDSDEWRYASSAGEGRTVMVEGGIPAMTWDRNLGGGLCEFPLCGET